MHSTGPGPQVTFQLAVRPSHVAGRVQGRRRNLFLVIEELRPSPLHRMISNRILCNFHAQNLQACRLSLVPAAET
ncbi:hypothetical protein BaRGS_00021264, partial [Batillaria attramentaria]